MKNVLFSRLKTEDFTPCLVALTESEILWKHGISISLGEVNRIDLREVVCVISVKDLCHETLPMKMYKSLRKRQMELLQISGSGFVVSNILRSGSHKWRTQDHVFWCDSLETTTLWITTIKERIRLANPSRPKRLLIFLNPSSGYKSAERIYDDILKPVFHLANIETDRFVTNYRGHLTECLLTFPLDGYDGIISVGGDGSFAEAAQGLLLRERLQAKLPLFRNHFSGSRQISPSIRIGIIPAGSTDTVVFSTQGTKDILTSALHIILGDNMAIDVAAVYSGYDGTFLRYAVSMLGFGFHADLLRNDDKLRWLGPRRYDYSGFSTFLQHAVYEGELSYLPSGNRNSHMQDGVLCASGCSVCSSDQFTANESTSTVDSGVEGSDGGIQSFPVVCDHRTKRKQNKIRCTSMLIQPLEGEEKLEQCAQLQVDQLENGFSTLETPHLGKLSNLKQRRVRCLSTSNSPKYVSSVEPSWSIQGSPQGWKTVRGTFVAVNACLLSCRCTRAASGPSPWAHLGDGCIDLIMVEQCSRARFLQFLVRTANASGKPVDSQRDNHSPFDLPFVNVQRVCAFKFKSEVKSPPLLPFPASDFSITTDSEDNSDASSPWSKTVDDETQRPSSSKSSNSRTKRSTWCADGELVHHENISVFVHRQLLRIFARGPEVLADDIMFPKVETDTKDCNKLFDAIVASATLPSKNVYSIPMSELVQTQSTTAIMISTAP